MKNNIRRVAIGITIEIINIFNNERPLLDFVESGIVIGGNNCLTTSDPILIFCNVLILYNNPLLIKIVFKVPLEVAN